MLKNLLRLASLMALTLTPNLLANPLTAQSESRVIKRVVLPGEPVEITSPRVNRQKIKFGQPFSADGKWPDGFALDARNTSDKTITSLKIAVYLRVNGAADHVLNMGLLYDETEIAPGETVQVTADPKMNALLMKEIAESGKTVNFGRAEIHLDKVFFKDGTVWAQGSVFRIDPNNSGKAEKVGEKSLN